jgi:hypothetical protein
MFKKAPQNIFNLASSEKGAFKNWKQANFESKICNASISAPANTVNALATFRLSVNHL